jgi:hypothetical protein
MRRTWGERRDVCTRGEWDAMLELEMEMEMQQNN